jgi:hypothetical protein
VSASLPNGKLIIVSIVLFLPCCKNSVLYIYIYIYIKYQFINKKTKNTILRQGKGSNTRTCLFVITFFFSRHTIYFYFFSIVLCVLEISIDNLIHLIITIIHASEQVNCICILRTSHQPYFNNLLMSVIKLIISS